MGGIKSRYMKTKKIDVVINMNKNLQDFEGKILSI